MLLREAVIVTKSPQEPVVLPPSESWIQFLFKGTLVFLFEGKKMRIWENPFEKVRRIPSAWNCKNNVCWENDHQLLLSLERGHRAWFGGIDFITGCQVWDTIKEVEGNKKGQRGHLPGLPGTTGPLSVPNFVSLSLQYTWSSTFPAQVRDSQARAGLGCPAEARRPRERTSESEALARGLGRGGGSPPLPPVGARELPTAELRLPQAAPAAPSQPVSGPRPHPAPPGRTSGGLARAPNAALLGRAPRAGVRPSRGYITGPGPSRAARGRRAQAGGGGGAAAHLP